MWGPLGGLQDDGHGTGALCGGVYRSGGALATLSPYEWVGTGKGPSRLCGKCSQEAQTPFFVLRPQDLVWRVTRNCLSSLRYSAEG